MHLPQGIMGWTVFATGLMLTLYRVHGIDAPRSWVEWVERQFTYIINLRFVGGILLIAAGTLGYLGGRSETLLGLLFMLCIAILALTGIGLLLLQNHMRHIIFASAESSDTMLRVSSIIFVLVAMALAIAPFFL
jgi:hypothetical protein